MAEKEYLARSIHGITKCFGSVVANDHIDLTLKKGEILALLGENGSGKTTLMNMLSGIYKPDSGEIYVNGELVSINSPEDSKNLGIGMVHQHFKLVENFTAADNIWIGNEEDNDFFLKKSRYDKIRKISEDFGFGINPEKLVSDMSVSEKQTIEILKVLYYGAGILILDEPTAVLTHQETQKLFAILRKMSRAGYSIIIITHKLNEVLELSDRVAILRKGQSIGTVNTAETNASELTNMMVGRAVELSIDRPQTDFSETLLEVKNLSILNEEGAKAINNISFAVHEGEILGVAGVAGCGQKELCEALAGLTPIEGGEILYKGENLAGCTPRDIIKKGISMSFIPEDRLGMGLAASLSITDNMMLKNYTNTKGPLVDRKLAKETADKVIRDLEVVTPSSETPVRQLSGGNVQKVLLGREIDADPTVIITAYPVRGLDINSSYVIYDTLNAQKEKGVGVVFVGEDLDVMLELCDKIMVLCHGKVTGIVDAKDVDKAYLGLLMTDALSEESDEDEKDVEAFDQIDVKVSFDEEKKPAAKKKKAAKEPPVHLIKRDTLTRKQSVVYYTAAIAISLILGGILVAAMGVNPFAYYKTMVIGCFDNAIYLRGFIRILIPLTITSLGIAYAFKMKFWNIGGNGQFIMGAVGAATVGMGLGEILPPIVVLPLCFVAGAVCGGLYGMIPAILKVKYNTNETLLTLMLNYIAFYFLTYLKNTMYFRKLSATGEILRPDFRAMPEGAWQPTFKLFGADVDIAFIIMLLLVAFTWIYFTKSKQGYEISVVGDSKNTARYAGMNVNRVVLRTMFISAAIVGIAGMLQVTGSATGHMLGDGITADVGFTGIIVAWLAKLSAPGILVVSFLMGILQKGAAVCESTFNISSSASDILQGIILFTILAADFFIRYRVVLTVGKKKKEDK
ncbi:MAG: ATP-binding cassette domain-containing protein [Firmicutes bacterium]|nr:ATP-binding cassette domain-containing protein [Bacillota bacterium]